MKINKVTLKLLRPLVDKALADMGKTHGVVIRTGNAVYEPSEAFGHFKLELTEVREDGTVASRERLDWATYAPSLGMEESWLDREFVTGGKTYRVAGFRPGARKFSVMVQRVEDGCDMLMTPERVTTAFAALAAVAAADRETSSEAILT